jgi:hypothetical protein
MLESFIASLTLDLLVSLLQQLSNGLHDLGEVWNESSIMASQSKETLYLRHCHWWLPFQDLFHLAGVHRDSFR